jgi:multidrug resistance efflux pump
LVKENQHVKAGEPIARLRSVEAEQQVQMAQSAVDEAKVRLEQAQRAPTNQSLLIGQQEQAVAGALSKVEGQRRQANKLKNLNDSSSVSPETFLTAKDQLQAAEALLKAEELKLSQLKLQNPQETIRLAEAGLRAAQGQLQLAKEQLHNHTLWAPQSGSILRVLISPGQIWGPSAEQPAVWFCPDKPRIIRCEINQRFARRVQQGQSATVYDDVDETKLGTGVVERVSLWISHRRSLIDEPLQRNDVRTLECLVQFRPDDGGGLRIGERVRVVIQTAAPAK